MTANSARGAEGEACEDADDGDDGKEFDQGEGRLLTQRSQRTPSPDAGAGRRRGSERKIGYWRLGNGLLTSRIPGTRPAVAGHAYACFRAQRLQRTPSPDRVGVKTERIVFCEVNIRGDLSGSRSCGMSWIFVLVERGESGCSHSYDLNFRSQISKGKKQFVHVGGVTGGDFDHWDAGGVGFASD